MKKAIIRICLIILIPLLVSVSVWLAIEFYKKRLTIDNLQAGLQLDRALKVPLQKELLSTKDALDKVKTELANTRGQLNDVNTKLAAAESNNARLIEEKGALEARLHSLKALKQAIRGVKREMWQERYEQILAKKEIQKQIDAKESAEGNMGFIVKDGSPTYRPLIRIEVRPSY